MTERELLEPVFLQSEHMLRGLLECEGPPVEVVGDDPLELDFLVRADRAVAGGQANDSANDCATDHATLRRIVKTWIFRGEDGTRCRVRGNAYLDHVLPDFVGRVTILVCDAALVGIGGRLQPWIVYASRSPTPVESSGGWVARRTNHGGPRPGRRSGSPRRQRGARAGRADRA